MVFCSADLLDTTGESMRCSGETAGVRTDGDWL